MAFFPCDIGPHPNPRRNVNVYLGLIGDGPDLRRSGRVCERHWSEVEPHLAEYEVMSDGITPPVDDQTFICPTCRKPIDQLEVRAFLTAYPTKNDRKDYWLNFHPECVRPEWWSQFVRSFR